MIQGLRVLLLVFMFIGISEELAYAFQDMPVIKYSFPSFLILILPTIALETYVVQRSMKQPTKRLLKYIAVANITSLMLGLPLTTLAHASTATYLNYHIYGNGLGPEFLWDTGVMDYINTAFRTVFLFMGPPFSPAWVVVVGAVASLIPFFPVSWFIEYKVVRYVDRDIPEKRVRLAVLQANLVSFCFPTLLLALWVFMRI